MSSPAARTALLDALDLSRIQDEHAREAIRLLLNLVDEVRQDNHTLMSLAATAHKVGVNC